MTEKPENIAVATTTKADVATAVYERVGGFSKRESSDIVDAVFELMKDALASGDKVKISGFGNFSVRYKRARIGRNPLTGKEIEIESRHVATFKASPVLKGLVNESLAGHNGARGADD